MAAGIAPECPECCRSTIHRARCQHSRPSALPLRFSRYITRLPHVQVRCRPSSDTVPSSAVSGFMSVCHHSPTANEARQHPREGAWFMHGWASLIRCDPVRSAPMTYEHDRAPAAFSIQDDDLQASVTPSLLPSVCACTLNGKMLALRYLSWPEIWCFLLRSLCVPSGLMRPRARTITGTQRTDCRAVIGTEPRV